MSGIIPSVLGFKTFCGDDLGNNPYFCANIEVSLFNAEKRGMHIILDGYDIALGTPTSTLSLDVNSDGAKVVCQNLGFSEFSDYESISISSWENVAPTTCHY